MNSKFKIFLLSPAKASGLRAQMLLNKDARFDLAVRLREEGAALGDVFTFMSGLYFRGKMAYAQAFASPPPGVPGAFVITAGSGLVPPETVITAEQLRAIGSVPIDAADPRYREPLERHTRILEQIAGPECQIVLLGSIATAKYLEPLLNIVGGRLLFPEEFAGRGDMSRGGLMLRCARAGAELTYVPALSGPRHGARPPKLPPIRGQ